MKNIVGGSSNETENLWIEAGDVNKLIREKESDFRKKYGV